MKKLKKVAVPITPKKNGAPLMAVGMKCGGKVKKMAKGGGVEMKGRTKGKMC